MAFSGRQGSVRQRKEPDGFAYKAKIAQYTRKILSCGLRKLTFLELQKDFEGAGEAGKGRQAHRRLPSFFFFFLTTLDVCNCASSLVLPS